MNATTSQHQPFCKSAIPSHYSIDRFIQVSHSITSTIESFHQSRSGIIPPHQLYINRYPSRLDITSTIPTKNHSTISVLEQFIKSAWHHSTASTTPPHQPLHRINHSATSSFHQRPPSHQLCINHSIAPTISQVGRSIAPTISQVGHSTTPTIHPSQTFCTTLHNPTKNICFLHKVRFH